MKSCLVVDDSSLVRKLAVSMLAGMGFDCREAADGQAAMEACADEMPDVILLDWSMPGMDGITFMRMLREAGPPIMPKIVFCTTHNELQEIRIALEEGADEYIMKPFDSEILRSKLEDIGVLEAS